MEARRHDGIEYSASEKEYMRRTYMDAGSEKLSGYADGANRFHDICFPCSTLFSSLHLYLYLSFILSLSFSFSFYFSFLLSSFPSQTRAYTLTSLSIQLFYDLSLSDTSISVLGHSYALRNHIFFVAPHPKIIGSRATMYRWEEEEI